MKGQEKVKAIISAMRLAYGPAWVYDKLSACFLHEDIFAECPLGCAGENAWQGPSKNVSLLPFFRHFCSALPA